MIQEITDAEFEVEVLKSSLPVLVDFYRPGCRCCPVLEELLNELQAPYSDKLKMVKLNTDLGSENAQRANVQGHPTSVIFTGGKIAGSFIGAGEKAYYVSFLEKTLT